LEEFDVSIVEYVEAAETEDNHELLLSSVTSGATVSHPNAKV
jgi:hypothetical protein